MSLGPVVVNGLYPRPRRPRRRPGGRRGGRGHARSATARPRALAAAAGSARHRTSLQAEQLDRLAERLPLPQLHLPYLFQADLGRTELDLLATALLDGIDDAARPRACRGRRPMTGDRRSSSTVEPTIIICCGSGGVGKTTTAAVLAHGGRPPGPAGGRRHHRPGQAARRRPRASKASATRRRRIEGDWPTASCGRSCSTPRAPSTTSSRATPPTTAQAERILANRFYQNISGALSGTQEYMAMEKLYELHHERRLRPRRGRHPADPPRPRLPRRPRRLDPLPRPPPLPGAHGPDPRRDEGGERGRAGVRPRGRQGGGRRGVRRRHHLLPGLRGHGGGLQGAGRPRARPARRPGHGLRARRVTAARHRRGGPLLRRQAGRDRHRRCGPSSSTGCTPASATRPARGAHASGPRPSRAPRSAGSTQPGRLRSWSPHREDEHLAGPGRAGRAGAGRPGAASCRPTCTTSPGSTRSATTCSQRDRARSAS